MRRKKMWRYYCDYCNKGGCSGGHMKTHETHCTKNPNRVCRMCDENVTARELALAVAFINGGLIERDLSCEPMFSGPVVQVPEDEAKTIQTLGDMVENCPACMLAALRQSDAEIALVSFEYFEYRSEAAAYLKEKRTNEEPEDWR